MVTQESLLPAHAIAPARVARSSGSTALLVVGLTISLLVMFQSLIEASVYLIGGEPAWSWMNDHHVNGMGAVIANLVVAVISIGLVSIAVIINAARRRRSGALAWVALSVTLVLTFDCVISLMYVIANKIHF
jgi:hypothetical protein